MGADNGLAMRTKSAALLAVTCLVAIVCVPFVTDPVSGSTGGYDSQLDANGQQIYEEVLSRVSSGLADPTETIDISIDFNRIVAMDSNEDVTAYIERITSEALFAAYYSQPMAVWLWDLPVVQPELTTAVNLLKITSVDDPSDVKGYFSPKSVSFILTVPEDMKQDLKTKIEKVTSAIMSVSGDVPSVVKAISGDLRNISQKDDAEGEISNVYDALVDRKSSSAGIAAAFTLVAKSNGLNALTVCGTTGSDKEKVGYWNIVDFDGGWYGVDVTIYDGKDKSPIMAGYNTKIVMGDGTYYERFGSTHIAGDGHLNQMEIVRNGYSWPDDRSIFEKWGNQIFMVIIVAMILGAIIYALKKDIV